MAETIIPYRFQVRGGTAAAITALNEVPKARELVFETDTGKYKLGDGATAWNALPYRGTVDDAIVDGVINRAPSQNAVFDALALKQPVIPFAVATGTADALAADFSPDAVLVDGGEVKIRAAAANTGATTLAVDGGTARAITKLGGTALAAGDIAGAGHGLILRYVASVPRWELLNPAAASGGGGTGVTAGDVGVGSWVLYNGTTQAAGKWDGGTTAPVSTTRLNFDGYLYATRFTGTHYGDGSNLTGIATGSIAVNDLPQVIQTALSRGNTGLWTIIPAVGGAGTFIGFNPVSVNVGTYAGYALTSTDLFSQSARGTFASVASAGQSAGSIIAGLVTCVRGGFHCVMRAAVADVATVANARMFVGLRASNATIGNVDPSTLTDIVGLGCDAGETTLSIIHNDGSGTATKVALGANFPSQALSTDVYTVSLVCLPGASSMTWHVRRDNTGHTASGTISTDMPTSTSLMAGTFWRNSGATALAVRIAMMTYYCKWNLES